MSDDDPGAGLSRRQMITAGTTGLLSATAAVSPRAAARGRSLTADGTPEQVHLTWGADPTSAVVVSWASAGQASRPRVRVGQRVIAAAERAYTDSRGGTVVWTYHALVDKLRPGATYGYAVTADNDSTAADPFSATFSTAPAGRARFRFTSFGDLAAPDAAWANSSGQAAYAVAAVETFQPLFHLLNGDLADADAVLAPAAQRQASRGFGNTVQVSAANRPWMPVPCDHESEPGDDSHGLAAYLTRYALPPNGVAGLDGRWYAFRVGTALFVCLSGDDVAYRDGGLGYSGGAQTRWLESTLAAARADASVDWIVVQLHRCACSSAPGGSSPRGADSPGGSDLGLRTEWLPLFDRYEVDLVLSGHDHGYERSFPVRGCDTGAGTDVRSGAPVDTRRPHPVTTVDSGVFDTSQGTVHLVLGCGGSPPAAGAPRGEGPGGASRGEGPGGQRSEEAGAQREAPVTAGATIRQATVYTRPGRAAPGGTALGGTVHRDAVAGGTVPDGTVPDEHVRAAAEAVEEAAWSARRDGSAAYGIAVFDVDPGSEAGGQTSVTVRYYRAASVSAGTGQADHAGQAGHAANVSAGTGQHGQPDQAASVSAGTSQAEQADQAGQAGLASQADYASQAAGEPRTPPGDYTLFETFTLVRPRSDGRRWHLKD